MITIEKREYWKNYSKQWRLKNPERYKERCKKWREKNREKILGYERKTYQKYKKKISIRQVKSARLRYQNLRLKALQKYGGTPPKCECCSETIYQFLCIDHLNGGGTRHRKQLGHGNIYEWLRKNNYPSGFRVLCANCNSSYGYYKFCPHKMEGNV